MRTSSGKRPERLHGAQPWKTRSRALLTAWWVIAVAGRRHVGGGELAVGDHRRAWQNGEQGRDLVSSCPGSDLVICWAPVNRPGGVESMLSVRQGRPPPPVPRASWASTRAAGRPPRVQGLKLIHACRRARRLATEYVQSPSIHRRCEGGSPAGVASDTDRWASRPGQLPASSEPWSLTLSSGRCAKTGFEL